MKFLFARDHRALASADHCLVIAPKRCFSRRAQGASGLKKLLPKAEAALALQLGTEVAPGLLGGHATTIVSPKRRLTVAALADTMSRHNSPARAEAIRKVTAGAGLSSTGKNAVLLVLDDALHVLPAVNALARALPTFLQKSGSAAPGTLAIVCCHASGRIYDVDAEVQEIAGAARAIAHLVDTPPADLDPDAFVAASRQMLKPIRAVRVREIAGGALLRERLHGLHAVGRCARSAPRLLVGTLGGRRGGPHVALVGKGITYDTGGLHLKARGSMESMKSDMAGAAAVLGAFAVLARHGAPCRVSMLLCIAENAIGPLAYKPDDILVMHSGKTVEINNTDAEGRLVLADGCSYAARNLGADIVIDVATLTGAQGVATGDLHAAVMSNDAGVEQALLAAGHATGDLCWPLPFAPEFYRAEFQSPIADMRNSVKNRSNAQTSCAGEFVHWHLEGTGARWGHIDLAFPAFRGDRATGFGVALLVHAVRQLGAR